MIKFKNCALLVLALAATTHIASACEVDSNIIDLTPKAPSFSQRHASRSAPKKLNSQLNVPALQTNKKEKDLLNRGKESLSLKFAIKHLQNKNIEKSIVSFREAIEINGSPLAYLYLSHLENDKETSIRYTLIAAAAVKDKAIDARTINEHTFYVRSLIRLLNSK